MSIRHDKFAIGDSVVWADGYDTLTDGRARYGDGPFRIIEVIDREYDPADDFDGQSNWSSMGHTQHVRIDADEIAMFSGVFFVKAGTHGSSNA